ncbi:hypothetical protein ASPACDRAFT_1859538 [Aspergillus aculeatus ATCC 16872]|uniref:Uncharacterized protein n=1 Tax=Aspergillus aculeatus (strain ATCC 16872 / CBS 172.66 / WB 5094) TaxID=690307 RepID=A0A1L9WJF7_ASPA1|nr:uncharacterized protein ASPACDRAFT_1859538 [Aspergillus aculeatus ATCC 16872]OJJ96296.1 hypothetical protein ASPACDRAFT_1859538 [Aspergillus aculeatus ATCC 16872]
MMIFFAFSETNHNHKLICENSYKKAQCIDSNAARMQSILRSMLQYQGAVFLGGRLEPVHAMLPPRLQRVGELNSSLSDTVGPNVAVNPMASRDLDGLESTVLAWQPDVPESLCSVFSAVEIAHIFCQVQAMRLCALLLIYRLKIPFGMHDAPARVIAISILTQLQTTLSVTGKAVKFAMLPVLVACVELATQTERDEWLSRVPELVCCSQAYGLSIQGAIRTFWTARDAGVVFRRYNISRFTSCSDDRSRACSKDRKGSGTLSIGWTAHI